MIEGFIVYVLSIFEVQLAYVKSCTKQFNIQNRRKLIYLLFGITLLFIITLLLIEDTVQTNNSAASVHI